MRTVRRLASLLPYLGLLAAGLAGAAPFAYVPHDHGLAVIDVQSRSHIKDIPFSSPLSGGVAFVPGLPRGYVSHGERLEIVDIAAQAPVSWIDVPSSSVQAVARHPARPKAYVATVYGCFPMAPSCLGDASTLVTVVNTDNGAKLRSFQVPGSIRRMAFSRDGTRVFMSNGAANAVAVVDADTDTVVGSIATPFSPLGLAAHPTRNLLYVAQHEVAATLTPGTTVAVIDLDTNSVVASIPVGTRPQDIAITPAGNRLFVTNRDSDSVSVIDPQTHQVIGTVPVQNRPIGIDITPDGGEVYVVNTGSGSVTVLEADSLRVLQHVMVGSNARAIGRFIGGPFGPPASQPGIVSGLWWWPSEPGWGAHLTLRRNTIFAALFMYDIAGVARWYVASNCQFTPPLACPHCIEQQTCSGRVHEFRGARFIGQPFFPTDVQGQDVGSLSIRFSDVDNGVITYDIRGQVREANITRQLFAARPDLAVDYTDLWWNPTESGWGLGVTQQDDVMFLTWFIYDDDRLARWYVSSNCVVNDAGNGCSGTLYLTEGPPGPPDQRGFDSSRVSIREVGTIEVLFTDPNNGLLSYRIGDVGVTKPITRQLF